MTVQQVSKKQRGKNESAEPVGIQPTKTFARKTPKAKENFTTSREERPIRMESVGNSIGPKKENKKKKKKKKRTKREREA